VAGVPPTFDATVRRAAVLSRITDDFAVVCATDGRCVEMAGTARTVWLALPDHDQPPVHIAALVAELAAKHFADRDVVAADVMMVLSTLEEAGCAARGT